FENRIVPTLGLDSAGYRRLANSGPGYRLALGPARQAQLINDKCHHLTELPEFTQSADPSKRDAARSARDPLRTHVGAGTQVREVMQFLTSRMERAMRRWRRWTLEDFEQYLVRHPLMSHLTRALLWGSFETISKVSLAFRVTESRTFVDAAGSTVELNPRMPI